MFTELIWRTGHLKPADFSTLKFQVPIVRLSYNLVSDDIFGSENHLEERIKEIWSFFNLQTGRYGSNFSKLSILDVDTQDFGYLSIFESESHLQERIKWIWSFFHLQRPRYASNLQNGQFRKWYSKILGTCLFKEVMNLSRTDLKIFEQYLSVVKRGKISSNLFWYFSKEG